MHACTLSQTQTETNRQWISSKQNEKRLRTKNRRKLFVFNWRCEWGGSDGRKVGKQ